MTPRRPLPILTPPATQGRARTLAGHVRALSSCTACQSVNPLVRPIIHNARAPKVVVLGQAPGRQERLQRRGFVGPSGQRLWTWLAQTGKDEAWFRQWAYITSVTKCDPGPHPSGRGDRVPSEAERACCAGWLTHELQLIQPQVIIAIGQVAIATLLGPAPLTDRVGQRFGQTLQGLVSHIHPLPHPSGASSWFHAPAHQRLIREGLAALATDLAAVR